MTSMIIHMNSCIYSDFDVSYTIFVTKDEKSLIESNLT